MQAIFNGTVLADSDDIVMADGNPYFLALRWRRMSFPIQITPRSVEGRARPATRM